MNNKEKLKRLKHLCYNTHTPIYGFGLRTLGEAIENDKKIIKNLYKNEKKGSKHLKIRNEIYQLAEELNLSVEEFSDLWCEKYFEKTNNGYKYRLKPQKEGRDNKGIYVGNGGSNNNKVRYPSKKRSKRVWKIFYSMFPFYAERDGWDGEKSSRFNQKEK